MHLFFLTFFLLIPQVLILNLIQESQRLNKTVIKEVAGGWANKQLITGPVLVIPYYHYKDEKQMDR
ncbi:MAG: inner membrane CreD family protein [Saprospiraceae bacterium]|nr:inner membrane CreD family protein [Saprospiraceae bacterium]